MGWFRSERPVVLPTLGPRLSECSKKRTEPHLQAVWIGLQDVSRFVLPLQELHVPHDCPLARIRTSISNFKGPVLDLSSLPRKQKGMEKFNHADFSCLPWNEIHYCNCNSMRGLKSFPTACPGNVRFPTAMLAHRLSHTVACG